MRDCVNIIMESATDSQAVLRTYITLVWPTSWTPVVGGLFVCEFCMYV